MVFFIILLVIFVVVMIIWLLALLGATQLGGARIEVLAWIAVLVLGVIVFLTGYGVVRIDH